MACVTYSTSEVFASTQQPMFFSEEVNGLQNYASITGKSALLNRIKYFENKTNEAEERSRSYGKASVPNVSHSIKNTIYNAREHFSKESEEYATAKGATTEKPTALTRTPSIKPTALIKEGKKHAAKFSSDTSSGRGSSVSSDEFEYQSFAKPTRKLSIKTTIHNAREGLMKENAAPKSKAGNDKSSAEADLDYASFIDENFNFLNSTSANSTCVQFFSTGSTVFLPEENLEKQFKVVLGGHLYQNAFYSLDHFDKAFYYPLDNLKDSDLPTLEFFEKY